MTNIGDERHKAVMYKEWKAEFWSIYGGPSESRKTWNDAKNELIAKQLVQCSKVGIADYCWVVYPEDGKDEQFVAPV
jgi:hypothetical protein